MKDMSLWILVMIILLSTIVIYFSINHLPNGSEMAIIYGISNICWAAVGYEMGKKESL